MTNAQEVQAYLRRHCGSHEAAREFLRLDLGPDLFWPALRKVWSGFDLIPAAAMVEEMGRRSEWWEPCTEWLALPQTFTAYRGQDASRDGICWSRDRAVTVTYTREAALDIAEALLRRASDNLGALTPEADLQMEAAAKAHDFAKAAKIAEDPCNIDRQNSEDVGCCLSSGVYLVGAVADGSSDPITLTLGQEQEELYRETLEGLYEIK